MRAHRLPSYTLMEMVLVIALMAVLSTIALIYFNPFNKLRQTQEDRALTELAEIGKAIQLYSLDFGAYPADVSRNLPSGIEKYITPIQTWPDGPFPGSVYDYDNWLTQTCIDPNGSNSVQISIRQVPGRNPDGSNVWAWYYVLQGKGTPHCNSASEAYKGECVNCPGFDPSKPPPN